MSKQNNSLNMEDPFFIKMKSFQYNLPVYEKILDIYTNRKKIIDKRQAILSERVLYIGTMIVKTMEHQLNILTKQVEICNNQISLLDQKKSENIDINQDKQLINDTTVQVLTLELDLVGLEIQVKQLEGKINNCEKTRLRLMAKVNYYKKKAEANELDTKHRTNIYTLILVILAIFLFLGVLYKYFLSFLQQESI